MLNSSLSFIELFFVFDLGFAVALFTALYYFYRKFLLSKPLPSLAEIFKGLPDCFEETMAGLKRMWDEALKLVDPLPSFAEIFKVPPDYLKKLMDPIRFLFVLNKDSSTKDSEQVSGVQVSLEETLSQVSVEAIEVKEIAEDADESLEIVNVDGKSFNVTKGELLEEFSSLKESEFFNCFAELVRSLNVRESAKKDFNIEAKVRALFDIVECVIKLNSIFIEKGIPLSASYNEGVVNFSVEPYFKDSFFGSEVGFLENKNRLLKTSLKLNSITNPMAIENISEFENFFFEHPFWVITGNSELFYIRGDGKNPVLFEKDGWALDLGRRFDYPFFTERDGTLDLRDPKIQDKIKLYMHLEKVLWGGSFVREPPGTPPGTTFGEWYKANTIFFTLAFIFLGVGVAFYLQWLELEDVPPRAMKWEPKSERSFWEQWF